MKKKCTNSACRRVFVPWQDGGVVRCPHCGKAYPRLKPAQTIMPALTLCGWQPSRTPIPAIKKLRSILGIGLRESKMLLDRMEESPIVLNQLSPGSVATEKKEWESFGVIVRLDHHVPVTLRQKPDEHRYMVLLTGYDPGAEKEARQFLRNRGHWNYGMELSKLPHQRIVISRNVPMAVARNVTAAAQECGLSAVTIRDRSGKRIE